MPVHSNFDMLIQALNIMVNISTTDQFVASICYEKYNEICINRKCKRHYTRKVIYSEFNKKLVIIIIISVNYLQWEYLTEKVYKAVIKIPKSSHIAQPYFIVIKFKVCIPKFTKLEKNIVHQYFHLISIKKCKKV